MREYDWYEYYDKFYDWADSTRIKNLYYLNSLGDPCEVCEIITELQFDQKASDRLLKMAVEEKMVFSVDHLLDFVWSNDEDLVTKAIYNSAKEFTSRDVERLYSEVDDEIIENICSKYKLALPEDLRDQETFHSFKQPARRPKEPGFFSKIFGFMGALGSQVNKSNYRNSHRCDHDCANCPPHYGYRYGRWYYGHGHTEGCEFGGNKGDGGAD